MLVVRFVFKYYYVHTICDTVTLPFQVTNLQITGLYAQIFTKYIKMYYHKNDSNAYKKPYKCKLNTPSIDIYIYTYKCVCVC